MKQKLPRKTITQSSWIKNLLFTYHCVLKRSVFQQPDRHFSICGLDRQDSQTQTAMMTRRRETLALRLSAAAYMSTLTFTHIHALLCSVQHAETTGRSHTFSIAARRLLCFMRLSFANRFICQQLTVFGAVPYGYSCLGLPTGSRAVFSTLIKI